MAGAVRFRLGKQDFSLSFNEFAVKLGMMNASELEDSGFRDSCHVEFPSDVYDYQVW